MDIASSTSSAGSASPWSWRRSASASAYPAQERYAYLSGVGRAGLHARLHRSASGAKSPACSPDRSGRYGTLAASSVLIVLGDPRRDELHRQAAEQALGPHGVQAVQPLGPEPQRRARSSTRRSRCMVFAQEPRVPELSRPPEGIRVRLEADSDASTSIPTRSRRSRSRTTCSSTARSIFNYKGRTERVDAEHRAGHHQRASSRS